VFDHVTIRASDREASERFYDTVLPAVGLEKAYSDERGAEWGDFSLAPESPEKPVTRRLHIAFGAPSRAEVDEFWRTGTEAGHRDDGPPGERPQYTPDYYGAFLLDPDGNSVEAVIHDEPRAGLIDHLWIRVGDLEAAKRFYESIAPFSGFALEHERPDRATFVGENGSFTLVRGEPTEHVHVAFPAGDDAVVEAFHEVAVRTGHQDNGPPGERPEYHAGYYGAFVLDPDGNNVEVVNHNRQ
jgi:catechol 2,3-dioxygenase-like lactoylglutathione lyase family enzyme